MSSRWRVKLVCVPADDYNLYRARYASPIAQEDIRLGEIVFIEFIPDDNTYGVFKVPHQFVPNEAQMGIALNSASVGPHCSVAAKGNIGTSLSGVTYMWAVVKS